VAAVADRKVAGFTRVSHPHEEITTRHFENLVRQGGKTNLLAAGGILIAAKEQALLQQPVTGQSQWQHERLSP